MTGHSCNISQNSDHDPESAVGNGALRYCEAPVIGSYAALVTPSAVPSNFNRRRPTLRLICAPTLSATKGKGIPQNNSKLKLGRAIPPARPGREEGGQSYHPISGQSEGTLWPAWLVP